jgi:hypothetical protein
MERLHAERVFRIRRLREGMRAWEELWRLLPDGPPRTWARPADRREIQLPCPVRRSPGCCPGWRPRPTTRSGGPAYALVFAPPS